MSGRADACRIAHYELLAADQYGAAIDAAVEFDGGSQMDGMAYQSAVYRRLRGKNHAVILEHRLQLGEGCRSPGMRWILYRTEFKSML